MQQYVVLDCAAGWHELSWDDVQRVHSYYEPWHDNRVRLDAVDSLEDNIEAAVVYLIED